MAAPVRRRALGCLVVVLVLSACGGDEDGDVGAFCDLVDDASAEQVFEAVDPDDLEGTLAAVRSALALEDRLAEVAPPAARADVEVLRAYLGDLADGLAEAAADPTRPPDERPAVYDRLRSRVDEVEAAGDRLDLFVSTSC